jgi:cell division protein FtsW
MKLTKLLRESKEDSHIDYLLLFTTFILLGIGLTALFSASAAFAYVNRGDLYFYLKRQLVWLAIGIISLWLSAKFNYMKYRVLYRTFLFLSVLFLCLVFVPGIGKESRGVYRFI